MALTDLNTTYQYGSYERDRYYFMALPENGPLFNDNSDQKTINGGILPGGGRTDLPTIGFGFDLSRHKYTDIEAYLTDALGGTLTDQQQKGLDLIKDYKDGALSAQDLIAIAQGTFGSQEQQTYLKSLELTQSQARKLFDDVLDGFTTPNGVKYKGLEQQLSESLGAADLEIRGQEH